MVQPLMQYLPPVSAQTKKQAAVDDGNLPALDLASTRDHYVGRKAFDYDTKNIGSEKWQRETTAIAEGLEGITGPVLDIPCGTGRFFSLYRERGLPFVAMDVSEDMMAQARAKDSGAQVVHGDIENIPLGDKTVECAVVIRLLEKLPEDEMARALKEVGRVTSKRILCGLITGDHVERRPRSWMHRLPVFQQAVREAGFRIVGHAPVREPEMYVWMLERVPSA